ncbi:thermonuclease family protein [Roseixanthobacter glucoisosaccharinicivorans]|uniref:thermonuclease family protein n=1 Tax=Roseixanthobacter glucoisosaccharinicivorans TaxID=3119923 RepID=UPI00372C674D
MSAARSLLISTVLALAVLSTLWIANDDRFGRPAALPHRDTSIEKFTISPLLRTDAFEAKFNICDGPIRTNCVVDGDTFWFKGDKIRIADIDAPEISSPFCEDEKHVGEVARDRLLALLNAGRFSLQSGWRDADRYGRKLRTVTRDDRSLGERLVEEGLARRWNEPRRDWCVRD